MQQFLVSGQALYVLAVICGLGVLCKWVTRILYKRLIKEAGNLAMTKNRNLKTLKQRVESTYRTNSGVGNMETYLEHQMYDFRFLGVTLTGWGNFSNQMTFLCFLAGGAAAFLSYWSRSDSYYIVLYGSMGILAGLFTLMVDSGVNLNEKREQLLIALEDYMDNPYSSALEKAEWERWTRKNRKLKQRTQAQREPQRQDEAAGGENERLQSEP
ncbi:hypothetical protein [Clostridium sp. AM58-1XD]|uniref:hypothetical protein n=1 Tax=Clostridium sp. AM58-1XD TaxID=2292307 RepID=UPI001FA8FFF4|nr:hypothetical protein [Clostridium sp. AM58-1XD]